MDSKSMKVAYSVTERSGKSYWTRIGVAYVNKDGSWNLKLDAIPVAGHVQLRDWEPRDDQQPHAAGSHAPSQLGQDDFARRARPQAAEPFV